LNYAGTSSAREWSRLETNYENLPLQLSQSLRSRIDWTKSGAIKVRDEHRARHPQVQISTSANVTGRRTDGQTDRQTNTACRQYPRLCIASRGKKGDISIEKVQKKATQIIPEIRHLPYRDVSY